MIYTPSNNPEKHYKSFEIKKENEKSRHILEPDYILKQVQTNLLQNVLNDITISKYAIHHLNQEKLLKLMK